MSPALASIQLIWLMKNTFSCDTFCFSNILWKRLNQWNKQEFVCLWCFSNNNKTCTVNHTHIHTCTCTHSHLYIQLQWEERLNCDWLLLVLPSNWRLELAPKYLANKWLGVCRLKEQQKFFVYSIHTVWRFQYNIRVSYRGGLGFPLVFFKC